VLKKRLWLVILGVLVILGSLTYTVFAGSLTQGGTEDGEDGEAGEQGLIDSVIGDDPDEPGYTGDVFLGVEVGEASEAGNPESAPVFSVDSVIGDDPDENGYTGEVFISDEETEPSEEGLPGESLPDWGIDPMDPQPDEIDGVSEGLNGGEDRAMYYLFTAGATMHPRDSDTTWAYGGYGCVYAPEGGDYFTIDLQIPDGSTIRYLRIFYYDSTNSYDGTAWITSYDGAGNHDDIISVSTTGNSGYGSALSAFSGEVVDNYNNSYVLLYRSSAHGGAVKLCGLRIMYEYP